MEPDELLALFRPLVGLVRDQVVSQTVLNFARAAEALHHADEEELRGECIARAMIALSSPSAPLSPAPVPPIRVRSSVAPPELEKALDEAASFVDILNPPKAP